MNQQVKLMVGLDPGDRLLNLKGPPPGWRVWRLHDGDTVYDHYDPQKPCHLIGMRLSATDDALTSYRVGPDGRSYKTQEEPVRHNGERPLFKELLLGLPHRTWILSERGRTWVVSEVPPEPREPVVGLLASVVHPMFGQAGDTSIVVWIDANGQPACVS